MTIMRVSLAGASLSSEAKERLARRLIDAFAKVEVGNVSPEIRAGFVVRFEEVSPDDLYMGERPMVEASEARRAAIVSAHVMAGPWNAAMKADLFARIEEAVRDVAGMPRPPGGADFWMTIVEVPEGAWGLGGRPVSIGSLAPVFAPEQQARIREQLAALTEGTA